MQHLLIRKDNVSILYDILTDVSISTALTISYRIQICLKLKRNPFQSYLTFEVNKLKTSCISSGQIELVSLGHIEFLRLNQIDFLRLGQIELLKLAQARLNYDLIIFTVGTNI